MKSIFDIEKRLDIKEEFRRFVKVFHSSKTIKYRYSYEYLSLFEFFDVNIFQKWKYRDTMLSVKEFLGHIGVTESVLKGREVITEEVFLRYMEFVLNMLMLAEFEIAECDIILELLKAAIKNIDVILEKMNYTKCRIDDKIILSKRNSDVDSVLEYVPKDIAECLLEYNDFRIQNDIDSKRKILKDIDLYIEKNIKIKSFDTSLDNAIGTVVNEMGVNHPINKEPYLSYNNTQLIEWYDKCFLMMIHAIRAVEVNKIKSERKELVQK